MSRWVLPNSKATGWRPEPADHRDKKFSASRPIPERIREPVRLKEEFLPPIRDQGNLGSCTGFGTTAALQYKFVQAHPNLRKWSELSPLFSYFNSRLLEGEEAVKEDSGAYIRNAIKAANQFGVAREDSWPYDPKKFKRKPAQPAYTTARWHQAVNYYTVSTPDEVMQALAADMPVVFGFSCFSNLNEADETGVIPMPGADDKLDGGHCVCAIGADPRTRLVEFVNSWGPDWGKGGRGFLPFAYFEQGLADDAWAVSHE